MKIDWNLILEKLKIDLTTFIFNVIIILIIFLLARLAQTILSRFTGRIIRKTEKISDVRRSKEIITSMTLFHSVGRYTIYFVAACFIIYQLGFGTALTNIVTAAGVGALVVSLGAQQVIRDIVAGSFIMFEKQYAVGDYVRINDYEGTVTSLAMRCTHLKNWKGQKIIVPNGQITTVVNYSGDFNLAIVEVSAPYEVSSDRVLSVLEDLAKAYYEGHRDICFEEPRVVGINSFDASGVGYAIYQKAVGRNHYQIQRDLRVLVKKRFDEEGISIPYTQIVIHEGEKQ